MCNLPSPAPKCACKNDTTVSMEGSRGKERTMPIYQNKENSLVNYNYFAKYTEQTKGNNYSPAYEGIESPEHYNCVSAVLASISEVKKMVF